MKLYEKAMAIASIFLILPFFACTAFARSSDAPTSGMQEAEQMVPAQAALMRNLDAKRMKLGSEFKVELSKPAKLHDGTVLPAGATLLAKVTEDQAYPNRQLGLTFSQAQLKDGKIIPIKATIVGIVGPQFYGPLDNVVKPGDQLNNTWTDHTLQIDQLGISHGVDLHSRIAARYSGVLVAPKGHDMKLGRGSEIELAIAPGQQSQQPGV